MFLGNMCFKEANFLALSMAIQSMVFTFGIELFRLVLDRLSCWIWNPNPNPSWSKPTEFSHRIHDAGATFTNNTWVACVRNRNYLSRNTERRSFQSGYRDMWSDEPEWPDNLKLGTRDSLMSPTHPVSIIHWIDHKPFWTCSKMPPGLQLWIIESLARSSFLTRFCFC